MLRIQIDDRDVRAAFTRLQRAANDLTPAFADIGEYVSRRVDEGFRREQDWYGVPWAPLSPKTIKRKQAGRPPAIQKKLQNTGLFRAGFSYQVGPHFVEVNSNRVTKSGIPLHILHQLGTRRMPKREVLPNEQQGLPPVDSQEIVDIIGDYVDAAW